MTKSSASKKTRRDDSLTLLTMFVVAGSLIVASWIFSSRLRDNGDNDDDDDNDNDNDNDDASTIFKDLSYSNDVPNGGLLCHLMTLSHLKNILRNGMQNFRLQDLNDCAEKSFRTCSAWTYLRSDLPGLLYIYPAGPTSTGALGVPIDPMSAGFIVDTRKIFPLVETMAIVDASADDRIACSDQRGTYEVLRATPDEIIFSPPGGAGVDVDCDPAAATISRRCRQLLAGGGATRWFIANRLASREKHPRCLRTRPATRDEIRDFVAHVPQFANSTARFFVQTWEGCDLCKKPFLCRLRKSSSQPFEIATDAVYADIGLDGSGWIDVFGGGDGLDIGFEMNSQGKFLPRQWRQWIDTMKKFYRVHSRSRDRALHEHSDYLANPDRHDLYFENEVDIFVAPHGPLARSQDDLFKKAIVGVFFVGSTCEEQLVHLETGEGCGATHPCPTFSKDGRLLNVRDRCDAYLRETGDTRVAMERTRIEESKKVVLEFVKKFNEFYRKNGTPVHAFECKPLSPTFIDSSNLTTPAFEDIFTKVA